jgi:hypothetical protein
LLIAAPDQCVLATTSLKKRRRSPGNRIAFESVLIVDIPLFEYDERAVDIHVPS